MPRSTSSFTKGALPAPPVSLSTCWDKGKWHFESESFPRHLPAAAGWGHIVAALRFLDERGQLTAAGKRELAEADEEIALLSEHLKSGARAFLDQSYEGYLTAMQGYDEPPPVHVLDSAWQAYTTKYDLRKRPAASAYQQLILDHAYDRTAKSLLLALDRVPDIAKQLRAAIAEVPSKDRSLIEAVLAAREGNAVELASSCPDAGVMLHALRYLDPRRYALVRLQAACVLADRLNVVEGGRTHLAALAHAVNLGATPEAEAGWLGLRDAEKSRLATAVNLLGSEGEELHLALCAMRTVGDVRSLALIDASVGDKREGTTYRGGRSEPSWEPIRREAREMIHRRQKGV